MGNVNPADQRHPIEFGVKARLACWWWCGDSAHDWFDSPPGEHLHGFACPHCRRAERDAYARVLATPVSDVPAVVSAWRDERPYTGLVIDDLCGGVQGKNFGQTYTLRCPADHKIDTVVASFVKAGCPWCRSNTTRHKPKESLRAADPELAALFHPTRNGHCTADDIAVNHRGPLWWRASHCCGHEWEEDIASRILGRRPQAGRGHHYCPVCESVWGSLAWLDAELAAEWHPTNTLTAWHVKPFSTGVTARWRCAADPTHEWDALVSDRSSGRLCPRCSTAGTSQIEKAFLAAAQGVDPDAEAVRIGRWKVDVLMPSLMVVIEYDGSYWHAHKHEIDARKTRDLIAAGYRVARIREDDLPHLDLHSSQLLQVTFRPAFGDPRKAVADVAAWAARPNLRTGNAAGI